MDKKEIAMHLTKKAMEINYIPHAGGIKTVDDAINMLEVNTSQVAAFYNKLLSKLQD